MQTTPSNPPARDDLNQYLTWANVIKVVVFLCTPIFIIAKQLGKETTRDYEIKTITTNITEINTTLKEVKISNENLYKEQASRSSVMEKEIEAIKAELKYIREQKN